MHCGGAVGGPGGGADVGFFCVGGEFGGYGQSVVFSGVIG